MKVYFILAPKIGSVKIGKSMDPDKRLASLQTSNADVLDILLVLPHLAPFEEDQLHWRFRKYRQQGEWFEYRGELRDFIEQKRRDPSPQPEDDEVLGESEKGKDDGYHYPKHDGKRARHGSDELEYEDTVEHDDPRPPMRSPAYGASAWWGAHGSDDDQQYWHERMHRQDS